MQQTNRCWPWVLSCEHLISETGQPFAKALALDPGNADAWATFAGISAVQGEAEMALDVIRCAWRLEPHTPIFDGWFGGFVFDLDRDCKAAVKMLQFRRGCGSAAGWRFMPGAMPRPLNITQTGVARPGCRNDGGPVLSFLRFQSRRGIGKALRHMILRLLPARWGGAAVASSKEWRVEFSGCPHHSTIWDIGGLRWMASGSFGTSALCPTCGKVSNARVSRP